MMTSGARGSSTPRSDPLERTITALVVLGSAIFVFAQLEPGQIFTNSTPTGGDMGAHVWGPAFLRDELLPRLRLTGWTPDWYSGFPAFHFYMVIPALMIVILDVGLNPFLSIPIVLGLLGAAVYTRMIGRTNLTRRLSIALVFAAPLLIGIPYNIAFKLVAVSGVVMFPVAAWALGHLGGLRFPGPAVLSVASLAFAFDRSFNIYGGNIASTLAGEFAASISLSLSLVALGFVIRGTRTGEYRGWAAVFIALTGLCHLLPAFFLLGATALLMVIRLAQQRWTSVPWLLTAGGISAFLSAFWVLPFFLRTDYLNDMGWERIEILHSPLVTRSQLNPSEILSDYPPLPVLLVIAAVGLVLSLKDRVELGGLLGLTAGLMALGFVYFPDGRLWNARILPFYYLSVTLLAGIGVFLLIRLLLDTPAAIRLGLFAAAAILLIPVEIRDAWVWPEPSDDGSYLWPALGYSVRVLSTLLLVALVGTEIPRQIGRALKLRWVLGAVLSVAVLLLSPARFLLSAERESRIGPLLSFESALWAILLLAAIVILAAAVYLGLVDRFMSPAPPVPSFPPQVSPDAPEAVLETQPMFAGPNRRAALIVSPIIVASVMFLLLGLAVDAVGNETQDGQSWTFAGFDITSDDDSFVNGWSKWNFSGLEAKARSEGAAGDVGQGGWEEYQYVQRTMLGVGREVGCGRAMWEFAPELNRYGTTMAMMLLPMWTDGCIGSMEGLYFEATPTVPYHFLLQSDLSAPSRKVGVSESVGGPSRAMRDLPYGEFDIDQGVERLQELGVRYYLAFSPHTIDAARLHPGLDEVTTAAPWVVFETRAELVEPLDVTPVVIDGVRDHQDQWLDVGVEWFGDVDAARPASSGPADWPRLDSSGFVERFEREDTELAGSIGLDDLALGELAPVERVEESVTVSNVLAETDRISFTVDQIGTPVLVRASYFPSWEASGAEGPFRVAPNFMVVVPTETDVELVFSRTGVDWLSIALTLAGIAGLIVVMRRPEQA